MTPKKQARTPKAPPPFRLEIKKEIEEYLLFDAALMLTLPPREQKVLRLRYGLDGEFHTLREIAETLNRCPERIRQIELNALRKLREMAYRKRCATGMTP